MPRYIVIIGGGFSDVGKGVASASIGYLLKSYGYSVYPLKFDGYLNKNSGTMNPYHKLVDIKFSNEEVFVLDDGFECDSDSGVYERFLDISLTAKHNLTGGQVFSNIINKEISGEFPPGEIIRFMHVIDECKRWVKEGAKDYDFVTVEVGGTIGDRENSYFIEAMRQLSLESNANVIFILIAPAHPILKEDDSSEVLSSRTKIIRRSVEQMIAQGIQPDIIICRCKDFNAINNAYKSIISKECNVPITSIFIDPDCNSIYELPDIFHKQGLEKIIFKKFSIKPKTVKPNFRFKKYLDLKQKCKNKLKIFIGSRCASYDSYVSLIEALEHASVKLKIKPSIKWIEFEKIKKYNDTKTYFKEADGVIITEDLRNIEEKLFCIRYARENNIPILGISLGFQLMVIEFARDVCGLKAADTEESGLSDKIYIIQRHQLKLGSHKTKLFSNSLAKKIFKRNVIKERHRHIGEVNPKYIKKLIKNGLIFSGFSSDGHPDILELPNHPFFIGVQFHPEYKSKPMQPSPIFVEFLKSCLRRGWK